MCLCELFVPIANVFPLGYAQILAGLAMIPRKATSIVEVRCCQFGKNDATRFRNGSNCA